ncbi:MAG: hypothetical protein NC548_15625 [Lachnospiraceae bacterium]|nr:hypothetical protein [Lachnospiraceae bacterium]
MKLNKIKYTVALITLIIFSLLTISLPFLTIYWYIIKWATKFDVIMLILLEFLFGYSAVNVYGYIKDRRYNE